MLLTTYFSAYKKKGKNHYSELLQKLGKERMELYCACAWCVHDNATNLICPVRKMPTPFLSMVDVAYFDYLVDPMVRLCIKLKISPNMVTAISVNVLIFGFYHLFHDSVLLFALCWVVYFVLDCVDGCLARASNQVTMFGDWFDHTRDFIALMILLLILAYKNKISLVMLIIFTSVVTINQLALQECFIKNLNDEIFSANNAPGGAATTTPNTTPNSAIFELSETYALLLRYYTPIGSLDDFLIKLFSPSFNNILQALCVVLLY